MIYFKVPGYDKTLEKLDNICANTAGLVLCSAHWRWRAGVSRGCLPMFRAAMQLTGRDKKGDGNEAVHDDDE